MSNLIFRLVLFCQLQAAVALLILPPAMSERGNGYLAAMEDKIQLLERDGPPRVIVVGGSSAAFGIHSPLLAEEYDRPVVNTGLHAALGLDFYLQLVQHHVRDGDLVLLVPEYAMLRDCPISPPYARNLLRQCPQAARYMIRDVFDLKPFFDQMAISEAAFWTQAGAGERWRDLRQWWDERGLEADELAARAHRDARDTELVRQRLKLRKRRPYTRYSFNEYGDMVGHHGAKPMTFDDRFLDWDGEDGLHRAAGKLNRFARACRLKGATVVLSYSPMTQANFAQSQTHYDTIHRTMLESLEIPVIGCPEQVAFPREFFFDTQNHLTETGQKKRTELLISSLKRHFLAENSAATQQWR